jgi:heme iron utilization protein
MALLNRRLVDQLAAAKHNQPMPETAKPSTIRTTDDEARALARSLLRTARHASLATLEPASGYPSASLVSLATDMDATPIILVSRLSGHTSNLLADGRASLLVGTPGKGDPLAHPRMTLTVNARMIAREGPEHARLRRRFLSRQPKAALYVDFPDFLFFALDISAISLNGGFGRAYQLGPEDMLVNLEGAADLISAEDSVLGHMNEDHAAAIALYATILCGAPAGAWRMTGVDPEGADLMAGEKTARLVFPQRVTTADAMHAMLVDLARAARAKTI